MCARAHGCVAVCACVRAHHACMYQIPTFVPSADLLRTWGFGHSGALDTPGANVDTWHHFHAFRDGIQFFTGIDDLFHRLRSADLVSMSMQMRATSKSHCEEIARVWRSLLLAVGVHAHL